MSDPITVSLVTFITLIFLIFIVGIMLYNRLVSLREECKNAFSQIDIQLKRRYDLIPNLVEVAKKYMSHERETLEAVISARNHALSKQQSAAADLSAASLGALNQADAAFSAGLGRLFALSESYPDLKADAQMIELSREIESTESRIAFARQAFNDVATEYNIKTVSIPSAFIAAPFGFQKISLLEAIENVKEREPVRVSF